VDGHLVLVNGVVAGDYALQLADLNALNARPGRGVARPKRTAHAARGFAASRSVSKRRNVMEFCTDRA
jgi:hypothetical protein